MESSRRSFLKIAGISLLGLGAKPMRDALAVQGPRETPRADALTAKRWAMVVDMSKCRDGCTACQDACHLVHNVPHIDDIEEEVKWIWSVRFENAFPEQTHEHVPLQVRHGPFFVLCNHCNKPPCVRVCPTKATFKRQEDGIVMMDFHRCIGCRFCMAACPFGSRSFNWRDPRPFIKKLNREFPTRTKGVVEKCNFCAERLAKGLIPACVEACEAQGCNVLVFGDLDDPDSDVQKLLRGRYALRRKAELGTEPSIFYIV